MLLLIAFVIYSDGIGTIIRLATSYGTELGIEQGALITAILLVQFAGIPFAFLFGMLAGRIGAKASIFIALAVYTLITVMGVLHEDRAGFLRARADGRDGAGRKPGAQPIAVREHDSHATVVGVLRLLLDLREIRRDRGTAAFEMASRATGSSRSAILSVMVFFHRGRGGAVICEREGGPGGRAELRDWWIAD